MQKSIYIDATHFGTIEPTGVERYVDELLPLLSQFLIKAGMLVTWIGHVQPADMPVGVTWLSSKHQAFWSQRVLPKVLKQKHPDLFFTPSGIPPVKSAIPTVMTVHDLSFYEYPAAYSKSDLIRLRYLAPMAARNATAIITPTEFVRQDVIVRWNLNRDKVVSIPLAYTPSGEEAQAVPVLENKSPLILFVGRIEEKKNLLPLIHAVATSEKLTLVLAGKHGVGAEHILAQIWQFPDSVRQRIILLGYVSEAEKRWLYEQATVIAVPGLAEGFGLSVLEGFYHKAPVVASASGSLPEVAGDGAVLIDGRSSTAWQQTLEEVVLEEALRTSLIKHGSAQLAGFSWQKCAEQTAQLLINYL